MPMFIGCRFRILLIFALKSVGRTSGSRTTKPSAQRDAGQRAELGVAALDQLAEQRGVKTRRRRAFGPG